jgi:hypothetical protein
VSCKNVRRSRRLYILPKALRNDIRNNGNFFLAVEAVGPQEKPVEGPGQKCQTTCLKGKTRAIKQVKEEEIDKTRPLEREGKS